MKVIISKEWTDAERLKVITLLSDHLNSMLKRHADFNRRDLEECNYLINYVSSLSADTLNYSLPANSRKILSELGIKREAEARENEHSS